MFFSNWIHANDISYEYSHVFHAYITTTDLKQIQIQMRTNYMTKINNTWALFSPIIQFTMYRYKSWNERGIQSDSKGFSDVINGGGLRPSEVKRSSQSKIIKPPTADHERRLSQGVNQQECRKKYRVNPLPWARWPVHKPEHWTHAGAFLLTPT